MASMEHEPITGVWRQNLNRTDPPTPPPCKNSSDLYQFQERPLVKVGWTCPPRGNATGTNATCSAVIPMLCHLYLVSLSTTYLGVRSCRRNDSKTTSKCRFIWNMVDKAKKATEQQPHPQHTTTLQCYWPVKQHCWIRIHGTCIVLPMHYVVHRPISS